MILKELQTMVDELNATNSTNDKKKVLENYKNNKDVQEILKRVYSPFVQFNVTSKNCIKNKSVINSESFDDILSLLTCLSTRTYTGHRAIGAVNAFIRDNKEFKSLIFSIIDKNLKTRTDATLINNVIPDCIPLFGVALANGYDENTKKSINWKDGWYVSRKLDGCRCVCMIDSNGDIEINSRNGKPFETLQVLVDELKTLGLRNIVLDGEICLINPDGTDDFLGVMREIRRKDHTIKNPRFKVFDAILYEDFVNLYSKTKFKERQNTLHNILKGYTGDVIDIVDQVLINSSEDVDAWMNIATVENWEGVMLRKNCEYEGKRTKSLLKVKLFQDAEYIVQDVVMGKMRVVSQETGLEVEEDLLSNIYINHKGFRVSVGSGFSQEQRRKYFKNPELIIGKTVTVKYFEETKGQNGEISLRFPTLKHIFENGREV